MENEHDSGSDNKTFSTTAYYQTLADIPGGICRAERYKHLPVKKQKIKKWSSQTLKFSEANGQAN